MNIIKKYKDWRWEKWHKKIHKKLALLFSLTSEQRQRLNKIWQFELNQNAVYIDESALNNMIRHSESFPWHESCKKQMVWFDKEGRYIKDDYLPDHFFRSTFIVLKVKDNKLYYFISSTDNDEYYYDKKECYPILNKRQIKKILPLLK